MLIPIENVTSPPTVVTLADILELLLWNFCVYLLLRASLRLLHLKMSRVYLALYSMCKLTCIAIMTLFQYS